VNLEIVGSLSGANEHKMNVCFLLLYFQVILSYFCIPCLSFEYLHDFSLSDAAYVVK